MIIVQTQGSCNELTHEIMTFIESLKVRAYSPPMGYRPLFVKILILS